LALSPAAQSCIAAGFALIVVGVLWWAWIVARSAET
jgi:hypothetical protein